MFILVCAAIMSNAIYLLTFIAVALGNKDLRKERKSESR